MKIKIKTIENAVAKIGHAELARQLTKKTGRKISPQSVNNWITDGVPYRWHEVFMRITKLKRSELRGEK